MVAVAQVVGVVLILLTVIDIFLMVLYARTGRGLVSSHVNEGVWRIFRSIAAAFPPGRDRLCPL